jgi:hypothetical protein
MTMEQLSNQTGYEDEAGIHPGIEPVVAEVLRSPGFRAV